MEIDTMTYEKADEILLHCSSYEKMGAILELAKQWGPCKLWLQILGEYWTNCDNIAAYRKILSHLVPKEGPVIEMMSDDEQAAYKALPDIVTIYRGCGRKNKNGASWSLDKKVAAKFPFLNRYQVEDPTLLTASVKKSQILAIKLDCNESEVITFTAKPTKREALLSPPIDLASCNIPQNFDLPVAYV
jgi:hypothetical protein